MYGFRLEGVPRAGSLLIEAPEDWPTLTVERCDGALGTRPAREEVTPDTARIWLAGGGFAHLDRAARHVRMHVPEDTTDGALVHPFLAPVALLMAWWLGRETFHGGAIVTEAGVWAVLGDKTAGKSTTLASLALAGVPVMSDDVLVLDGGDVLAGPRSVDLRADAAHRLGAGEPLGTVGARERWRLSLEPVAARLPLRGWVTLAWGDRLALEPVRGQDRLAALLPHRGVRLAPAEPARLMQLSALPHWRLVRPPDWSLLGELRERLLDAIAG